MASRLSTAAPLWICAGTVVNPGYEPLPVPGVRVARQPTAEQQEQRAGQAKGEQQPMRARTGNDQRMKPREWRHAGGVHGLIFGRKPTHVFAHKTHLRGNISLSVHP